MNIKDGHWSEYMEYCKENQLMPSDYGFRRYVKERHTIVLVGGPREEKDVLKVVVKDGCELAFEQYCEENWIFCKAYPIEILKTRYRAECKPEQLKGAEHLIVSVEDMPTLTLS